MLRILYLLPSSCSAPTALPEAVWGLQRNSLVQSAPSLPAIPWCTLRCQGSALLYKGRAPSFIITRQCECATMLCRHWSLTTIQVPTTALHGWHSQSSSSPLRWATLPCSVQCLYQVVCHCGIQCCDHVLPCAGIILCCAEPFCSAEIWNMLLPEIPYLGLYI